MTIITLHQIIICPSSLTIEAFVYLLTRSEVATVYVVFDFVPKFLLHSTAFCTYLYIANLVIFSDAPWWPTLSDL